MKQERQHLQLTKKQLPPQKIKTSQEEKESKDCKLDYFLPPDTPNAKKNGVMCSMIEMIKIHGIYEFNRYIYSLLSQRP